MPQRGSNRGYETSTIIESFIASIWCGANRFLHTEVTRHDAALGKIFGWKNTPGQDVYRRFFSKFTQAKNHRVSEYFYTWIFDNFKFDNFTLDIDSSVMTRYGTQDGAKKGYNPAKKGRASHHPLIAFIADVKLVANMWLRSGDTSSANNFLGFLEDTLSKLKNKTVSLIRLDSGFFQSNILDYLEEKTMEYVVAAKFTHPIQRIIDRSTNWILLDVGIEICEQMYQSNSWTKPRRMVIVRQRIKDRPQAPGKQLSLFSEEEIHRNYRYSAYVTNLKLAPAEVWRIYRGRGDAENRIKELKYDFGFDSFNLKDFYATEAALTFAMIAYNLMSLFRTFLLQEKTQKTLSTLRYKAFAVGAYFEKLNDKLVLKIALNKKRRAWFSGLWNYSKVSSLPMRIVASVQSKRGSSRGLVHYVAHSKLDIEKEPGEGRPLFNAFTDNLSVKSANNSLKADISRGRPSNDELHHLVLSFRPDDYRKLGPDERNRGRALKEITRAAIKSLENSLGAERIAWAAAVHLNTENPHVHIALQKQYFTKEIERHLLSKIPRADLPHYESRSGERVLVPGTLIDGASKKMETLIDRELVFVKDHKSVITKDISGIGNKDKPDDRSAAKTAGEREALRLGIIAEYSLRRIDAKIESLIEHGHDMRFQVFDPLSGRKRRLSLRDIERREGATAGAKEGHLDPRSEPESAMVRRIKTILFKMVSKEETVKARLQKSFRDHMQEAAGIRIRYRREGRKLPVPGLSKKELDMIQGSSLETSDIRGFAYLERIRSKLTRLGEIEPRNKDDNDRLRAQKTISYLRSKLCDKTYREFSDSRYDRLVEIDGKPISLARLDRENSNQKSSVAVIVGKLTAFAKRITGTNADQDQTVETERLRTEILRKLDERVRGIAKEGSVENKRARLLDKIIRAGDEKFAGDLSGAFSADQMSEVETMALRLRLASIYESNWAEQRSLIEKSGSECPAYRRLSKATQATDFDEYKNEIIAGRALAREIVTKIEFDKAKEDLNLFKKAKRFQKFAVTDQQTGGVKFISLKDVELPKTGSILDRVVDEFLEGKDHRRIRKTVTSIVKERERSLTAEVSAAKEVANSATRIASEFKQFTLFGLQSEPTHSPLFSSAEIVMIENRAAKTSSPRDAARLNAVIEHIADRPTHSLAGILRDFENSQLSPELRERSARKATGSDRDGANQNLRDIGGEVRATPVDAPKQSERSPRDTSRVLGR